MTPDQLIAFIEEKMSMQHVYQPLLIKVLVESGGSANWPRRSSNSTRLRSPTTRVGSRTCQSLC